MKLFKKQKGIMQQIKSLIEAVGMSLDLFREYYNYVLEQGPDEQSYEKALRVHDSESRIDDIVRDIEKELYCYSLIPESRTDVLHILDAYEKIPDNLEHVCFDTSLQKIRIPEDLKEGVDRLIDINVECVRKLNEVLVDLFYDRDVEASLEMIDKIESRSDTAERTLMKKLFLLDIDKADKILLRDTIRHIGHISDKAQDTTDVIALTVIKRRM